MQRGKKVKNEGWTESLNLRWIDWLLVQSLDEFEEQQRAVAEEKQRKKEASKRRRASIMSLTLRKSKSEGDVKEEKCTSDKSEARAEAEAIVML